MSIMHLYLEGTDSSGTSQELNMGASEMATNNLLGEDDMLALGGEDDDDATGTKITQEDDATALAAIELNESVMVSAHTSAGKTVVAQYAIAISLNKGQRVVYTSPIKALSNQKYRELSAAFGNENVGLMTGDVNVNVDASCLVMTTEILRNMLYKGHELVREVQWVIFDEVHYMRDKERGVIWEECIILLPSAVRFVFLSATVPNGREFAAWVAQTHQAPVLSLIHI